MSLPNYNPLKWGYDMQLGMLVGNPRSGTTAACEMLDSVHEIGWIREEPLFPGSVYYDAFDGDAEKIMTFIRGRKGYLINGFKATYAEFMRLTDAHLALVDKFIFLRRDNLLRNVLSNWIRKIDDYPLELVSGHRPTHTRRTDLQPPVVRINDVEALWQDVQAFDEQNTAMLERIKATGKPYKVMTYADFFGGEHEHQPEWAPMGMPGRGNVMPAACALSLGKFLGVPGPAVFTSRLIKVNPSRLRETIVNFKDVAKRFNQPGMHGWLKE